MPDYPRGIPEVSQRYPRGSGVARKNFKRGSPIKRIFLPRKMTIFKNLYYRKKFKGGHAPPATWLRLCPEVSQRCPRGVPEYPRVIPEISRRYPRDIQEVSQRYP